MVFVGRSSQIKFSARIVKSYNISIFSGERAEREESSSLSVVEPESKCLTAYGPGTGLSGCHPQQGCRLEGGGAICLHQHPPSPLTYISGVREELYREP